MKGILVTIDGPAGSGKSSVARQVAGRLGVVNLNTGAAYRAAALLALREGADLSDEPRVADLARRVGLDPGGVSIDGRRVPDPDLRTPEVAAAASRVSAGAGLREVLLPVQRAAANEARDGGGAVVEGRDIGTVVLPDAELKIFLSADPEERARRRARQTGREGELDRIREAISRRDRQDIEREVSPLKPAPDAVVLDTTELALEEVVARVLDLASGLRRGA
ncbi:MAG: Cytidylate kinase [uncultured Rubrobacteraceae bacterium]|uniref:Cytidylate kinase n=1 Tax=uncultured Rubrobacteraceae bacterium TaxID=349277 RepID=A0A6J4PGX8_9ACTN|nr:MAG: Cytidylate kinase [uncultured Rubrobacteraceae bacterium]